VPARASARTATTSVVFNLLMPPCSTSRARNGGIQRPALVVSGWTRTVPGVCRTRKLGRTQSERRHVFLANCRPGVAVQPPSGAGSVMFVEHRARGASRSKRHRDTGRRKPNRISETWTKAPPAR
jgi:hypothetical protein